MRVVRSVRTASALAALLSFLTAASPAAAGGRFGKITHEGAEMAVDGVVAVWDAERPRFRVYLFPFEPTAEEIELCRSDDAHEIRSGTARGHYSLSWFGPPEEAGDPSKANVDVLAQNVLAPNNAYTNSVMMDFVEGDEVVQILEGDLSPGSEIHLRANAAEGYGGAPLGWDLDLTTEVLAATE